MTRLIGRPRSARCIHLLTAGVALYACGGESHDPFPGLTVVSGLTPFTATCNGAPQTGVNYVNSKVEPFLAVDPVNPAHLIGVWQEDRWSTTGANGLLTGVSWDGGRNWTRSLAHLSRCAGGNQSNGGDYERASDPWITISPDGTAYQVSVSFNNSGQHANKAILVSRSTDGGLTWSEPTALARDVDPDFALDKETVTADPQDPHLAYAVWDRLTQVTNPNPALATGPTWFTRMVNGSWEPARAIYDPGVDAQTISNQIAVLPNGTLVNLFLLITNSSSRTPDASVAVLRSTDKGMTWSPPIIVERSQSIGVLDTKSQRRVRSGELIPGIAADPSSGKVYLVWQDARFSNGVHEGIALSMSTDAGLTWSTPVRVNQVLNTHAFTPSIAVTRSGKIGVTYYDLRSDNPGDSGSLQASYWLVTSADGGTSWQETALAGPFNLRTALFGEMYFLGDYESLAVAGESFIPFFSATNSGHPDNPTDIHVKAEG